MGAASGVLNGTYPGPGLANGVVTPAKLSGVGPADVGAAAAVHASRHASAGADPITPADIGAAPSAAGLQSASGAGQIPVSGGVGTSYPARPRLFSGTAVQRDALSAVEGDHWYVSSGAGSGVAWDYVGGAWKIHPLAENVNDYLAAIGGIKLPVGPSTNDVLTFNGTSWVAAAPAGGSPTVVSDPMTGVGWSFLPPSSGTTATWVAGGLSFDCDPAINSSCGVERANYLPTGEYYDIAIRIQVLSGDNIANTRVILSTGQDDENCVSYAFFTTGSLEIGYALNGAYNYVFTTVVSEINDTLRLGGQLWIRTHRGPTGVAWLWGEGAGSAMPVAWHEFYSTMRDSVHMSARTQNMQFTSNGRYVQIAAVTLSGGIDLDVDILAIKTGLPGAF